ncbi:MAG: glycosyltransferase N-terminal domain-containing protein [Flavobacteriales bacterium]
MRLIYHLGIRVYGLGIRIAALSNPKAKSWITGRKGLYQKLEKTTGAADKPIWFHCASLGEFEQGRPLIERIKGERPERKILLSFFSPSGYEAQKEYPLADCVCYLPLDTRKNMRRFVKCTHPALLILVKYEFWANLLRVLHERKIPVYCISARFRKDQVWFKPLGSYIRRALKLITHFFVQDEQSVQCLQKWGIKNVLLTGDTRYDRVIAIKAQGNRLGFLEEFKQDEHLFIAGSSWRTDERALLSLIDRNPVGVKYLIAPHHIDESHIEFLVKRLHSKRAIRYTQVRPGADLSNARVLILDTVGLLSQSYAYGDIAYVGGGFGKKGIHNILEPAAFGNAVFFGPNYAKFTEARQMLRADAGLSVSDAERFLAQAQSLISNAEKRNAYGTRAARFVKSHAGATDKIYRFLKDVL